MIVTSATLDSTTEVKLICISIKQEPQNYMGSEAGSNYSSS